MFGITFIDRSDDVKYLLMGATKKAARVIGTSIQKYARQIVPKAKGPNGEPWNENDKTGLKQSIKVQVYDTLIGPAVSVGSNMQIAPYIELGTGKLYNPPPEWLEYHGHDKHSVGGLDSWLYFDPDDHQFKVGKPVPATPFLRPAVMDHINEYKETLKEEMENA